CRASGGCRALGRLVVERDVEWNVSGHRDLTCSCRHRVGPGGGIDRQFDLKGIAEATPSLTNCPHWRSVFSSVFKEPKLSHIRPSGLGTGSVRAPRSAVGTSVGRRTTLLALTRGDNPSAKNFDEVM